jgi:cyclase
MPRGYDETGTAPRSSALPRITRLRYLGDVINPSPNVTSGAITALGGGAFYLHSRPEAASNAGIFVDSGLTVVIDSRLTPGLGAEFRDAVRSYSRAAAPPLLLNTHYHGDHWMGNGGFADSVVVASEWTRQALEERWQSEVRHFAAGRPQQAREFEIPAPHLPQVGLTGTTTVRTGEQAVSVQLAGPAHTPGDLVVWTGDDRVLFSGDIVFNGHWPVLRDADVPGWMASLRSVLARGPRVIVPGHGPAGGPELAERMLECLELLVELAALPEATWDRRVADSPFAQWLRPERVAQGVARIRQTMPGL